MKSHIHLKLFATLQKFNPQGAEHFAIESGTTVGELLQQLEIPEEKAKLIFIDGLKGNLKSTLKGGERVGIFPPVGGG